MERTAGLTVTAGLSLVREGALRMLQLNADRIMLVDPWSSEYGDAHGQPSSFFYFQDKEENKN